MCVFAVCILCTVDPPPTPTSALWPSLRPCLCGMVLIASLLHHQKRWVKVTSTDLVPGDLISLYHSGKSPAPGTAAVMCPADVLLLKGSCVVNEAMLTGESVPQQKVRV